MRHRLYAFLFASVPLLALSCNAYGLTISESLHSAVLGSKDANPESTRAVHQALEAVGVKNTQEIPVKVMNRVGPLLAGDDLLCFTADGIWLNEDALKEVDEKEKTFLYHHEAVHYKEKHHRQFIMSLLPLPVIGSVSYCIAKQEINAPVACLVALVALTAYIKQCILPDRINQELQADGKAAQTLSRNGQQEVVDTVLKRIDPSDGKASVWFSSNKERHAIITSALQK